MDGDKVLRGVFFGLACAILMAMFYEIFFQVPIKTSSGVTVNGVLQYSSLMIEHPISKYYYSYCYLPNIHMEDNVDLSLGATLNANFSNIMTTESDLSAFDSDNSVFGSSYYHYSSGWY